MFWELHSKEHIKWISLVTEENLYRKSAQLSSGFPTDSLKEYTKDLYHFVSDTTLFPTSHWKLWLTKILMAPPCSQWKFRVFVFTKGYLISTRRNGDGNELGGQALIHQMNKCTQTNAMSLNSEIPLKIKLTNATKHFPDGSSFHLTKLRYCWEFPMLQCTNKFPNSSFI